MDNLMSRIGARVLEQDDLLGTIWMVRDAEDRVLDGLFERLVDACLDQLFLDLEFRHRVGELDSARYLLESARLVDQCRTVGLAPPLDVRELDLDLGAGYAPGEEREPGPSV